MSGCECVFVLAYKLGGTVTNEIHSQKTIRSRTSRLFMLVLTHSTMRWVGERFCCGIGANNRRVHVS